MIGLTPLLYIGWKLVHKTKFRSPHEVDLVKDVDEVEEYQRNYIPEPPRYVATY